MSAICKGCGREIFFAKNFSTRKTVPLEKCNHVYRSLGDSRGLNPTLAEKLSGEQLFISHFLVCPKADTFSNKNEPPR